MSGETADISHLCQFAWYDWLMFRDTDGRHQYPDDFMTLGRYLGPATDVGSVMTHKILKSNGEHVCRSTARPLTDDEQDDPVHKQTRRVFNDEIARRLGHSPTVADFPESDLTPDLGYYEDDFEHHKGSPDDLPDVDVTPKGGDNYLNVELMFPRGTGESRGRVTKRARGPDGLPFGTANQNPILDSRMYTVEFDDGTEAELTANMIAQSMYAQCDPEGNQYILLDSIVD